MASALTICTDAASQLGIIGQGEVLAADDAQRLRRLLNNMVSGWRAQFGTVIAIDRNVFPLVANQQTYTIGPSGDFDVPRPETIEGAGLLLNGLTDPTPVEIPRDVITDEAYQAIQIKSLSTAQFTLVYYNPSYPLGTVFLWPSPNTAAHQLVLYLPSVFTGFADLVTSYDWPSVPGYLEALEYNLAVRAAAPFGKNLTDYPMVVQLARESLGIIKRANNELVDLPTDASVLAQNLRAGYNINTGTGGY